MAKRTKIDTMDFINSVYGMTASYESSSISYGRKSLNSEYEKPVNAYALAEALSFIKADEYKQMAQTAMITALGEHAKMIQIMKNKGFSRGEIRSFSESTGFGEVSLDEVKETVVEGAKDAWKALLALIDKLIEVIKQFIRGIFDKEKQLGTVIRKINVAKQRLDDEGKIDTNKDIQVAFTNPLLVLTMGVGIETSELLRMFENVPEFQNVFAARIERARNGKGSALTNEEIAKIRRELLQDSALDSNMLRGGVNTTLSSLADVFGGGGQNRASLNYVITSVCLVQSILMQIADGIGIRQIPRISNLYSYRYPQDNPTATYSVERNNNRGNQTTTTPMGSLSNMDVSKYKADWATSISLLKDIMKDIKETKKNEKGTVRRG